MPKEYCAKIKKTAESKSNNPKSLMINNILLNKGG